MLNQPVGHKNLSALLQKENAGHVWKRLIWALLAIFFMAGLFVVSGGSGMVIAECFPPDPPDQNTVNTPPPCPGMCEDCPNPPPPPPPAASIGGGDEDDDCPATNTSSANPVYLSRGSAIETETDLKIAGSVIPWSFTRKYDSLSTNAGGAEFPNFNGARWQTSALGPYIRVQTVLIPGEVEGNGGAPAATTETQVLIFFSPSAKRTFRGSGTSPTTFAPPSDYAATLERGTTDGVQTYTLTETDTGNIFIFYGASGSESTAFRLKEKTTRTLQAAGLSGLEFSYDTGLGYVSQVTTAEPQSWTVNYSYYASGAEAQRLQQVQVKNASNTVIAKAEYLYYGNVSGASTDIGSAGDLVQVKVSRLASNGIDWIVRYTQYRYYTGTTGARDGSTHQLKMVLESDAIQRLNSLGDAAIDTPEELLTKDDDYTVSSNILADFSSRSFKYYYQDVDTDNSVNTAWGPETLSSKYGGANLNEYDSSAFGRVKTERVNGSCGNCSASGAAGISLNYYYMELNGGASDDPNVVTRIVVEDTVDSQGTPLYRTLYGINGFVYTIRTADIEDPTAGTLKSWCKSWILNSQFGMSEARAPSAHTSVTSNAALTKFLNPSFETNDSDTLNSTSGVIKVFEYDTNHRPAGTKVKQGSSGTAYYIAAVDYGDGITVPIHLKTATYAYPTKTTTRGDGIQTAAAYTFWDTEKQQIKKISVTLPSIATSQNGPNQSGVIEQYFDKLGRKRWTKDALGYVNYYSYHPENGQEAYVAIDVDPTTLPSSATGHDSQSVPATEDGDGNSTYDPSGIPTRSGAIPTPLELVTTTEHDDLGRITHRTEPGGAQHYLVYQSLRTLLFPYWDSTSSHSLLPIQATVLDPAGRRLESYGVRADYSSITLSGSAPTGFSSEPSQSDYVSWTTFNYDPLTNKLATVDRYHDIPSSGSGTLSTHFARTVLKYDDQGRRTHVIQTVSGTSTGSGVEQVQQTVYDVLGRTVEFKAGVSDASHDMGSGYGSDPTLQTISKLEYDGGSVGDSNLTKQIRYHGTGVNDYTGIVLHPTYRGHNRGLEPISNNGGSETSAGPFTILDVRWDGETTAQAEYKSNPSWATVLTGDGYTDYASSIATNRGTLTQTSYDDLARPYRQDQFSINPSTGATENALRQDLFYDLNGQLIAGGDLAGGTSTELAYDAAGRRYQSRTVLQLESTKFSSGQFNYRAPLPLPDLTSMSGGNDGVITLSHSQLDADSNILARHTFDMTHDDGTPGIDLTGNDDYVRSTTYLWYDDADRRTASAFYGSGDTAAGPGTWKYAPIPTRPGSAPATSNTVLVTSYGYDSETGVLATTTDPLGWITKTFQDDLGRITWLAEHFDNFAPDSLENIGDGSDSSKDRVTHAEYNGLSLRTKLTAYNGSSGNAQLTQYLYEDGVSAARVTSTIYPDSSDTTSSGSDQVKFTLAVDGLPTTRTDQRGTVIHYGYDALRRSQSQKVTNLGGSTDGTVLAITRGYDALGRVVKISSHGNATDDPENTTDVRNQVVSTHDGLGNVTKSEQSHAGVVSSSPSVQYGYDTTASGSVFTNGFRPNSIAYPDGRVLFSDYGSADSLFDRLTQVQNLRETNLSGTILAKYAITGSGSTVLTDYQIPDLKQDLFGGTSATYSGLDRFGRTKDHRWYDYTSGTVDVARHEYGYDFNSNRLWSEDVVAAANSVNQDELYAFDGLNRITRIDRGHLTTNHTVITSKTFGQDFGLDQLNNWPEFTEDPDGTGMNNLSQTRDHNAANEITQIDSASTYVAHDAAGNLTTAPQPDSWNAAYTLTWDAWNRLVKVADGANTVAEYAYDGLNRRIVKQVYASGSLDHSIHYYVSEQNQVLETRIDSGSTPYEQFTWGERYIDDLVLRSRDTDANGSLDETLYALQDSHWNVVALADGSGTIQERFLYDPYGSFTILEGDFSADSDSKSDFDWEYRFTSREFDSETGLHYFRARYYHDGLGQFIGRDPLEYIDGGNLYTGYFVPGELDPWGEDWLDSSANFFAGWGDTLSFGATNYVRDWTGINDGIDKCSTAYNAGEWTGVAHTTAMGFAGGARAAGA